MLLCMTANFCVFDELLKLINMTTEIQVLNTSSYTSNHNCYFVMLLLNI